MSLESHKAIHTRGSSSSRMARGIARAVAGVAVLLGLTAALRAQGGDKAKVSESVRADLARLADLERAWYQKNHTFTTDLRALGFVPSSGANITMSYASGRSWAANATHPLLSPTSCVIVGAQAGSKEAPFCTETPDKQQVAQAPSGGAGVVSPKPTPAPQAAPKAVVAAPQVAAPPPAQKPQVVVNRRPARRAGAPAPVPTTVVELPARAPSSAVALASTRAAGGAVLSGTAEAVTPAQFTERLNAFVSSALEVSSAKMPEVARDPYENTAEYQARVQQAMAVHQRRESEFYARNAKTYVVSIPVKDARYDADREVVDFVVDPIALPATRTFAASEGAQLSVACYSRPIFWCSADGGMQYDGTDLWRVTRATARSADVLRSPLTLVARFVVGRRDDARSPAVSLVSMELQAKGAAISRWEAGAR